MSVSENAPLVLLEFNGIQSYAVTKGSVVLLVRAMIPKIINRCVSRICFQVNRSFSLVCTNFHKCSGFQPWTFQPEKLPTSVAAASAGVAEISCVKKQGPLKALKLTFNPSTLRTVLLPLPFHLSSTWLIISIRWPEDRQANPGVARNMLRISLFHLFENDNDVDCPGKIAEVVMLCCH